MPGSHPSNSPIADANGGGGSTVNENDTGHRHHRHTYDQRQQSEYVQIYDTEDHTWSHEHHHNNQLDERWSLDLARDGAMVNDRRFAAGGWGAGEDNIEADPFHQQRVNNARIAEFVRPTNTASTSIDQPHTIESYIDYEDYRFMLARVSSIHLNSPGSGRDSSVSDLADGHTHSPYSVQVEELTDNGSDQRSVEGDDVALIFDAIMTETDRGQDNLEETASENIYDSQHIMVHNQRVLEHQMLRARADYNESPTRRPLSFSYIDNRETMGVPQSFESFHSNTAPLNQDEEHPAAALDQYSPTYGLGGFHQQQSMSISSSYFSPSTESTIVLSSPPPGRVSGSFPYSSQSTIHPYSARPAYTNGQSEATDYSVSSPNHNGGSYRPFVTGRELTAQQQQLPLDPRMAWPRSTSPWEEESSEHSSDNELDMDGGRIISGTSEGGSWSIYGSVTRSSSFEEHRYRHHHRQQHHGAQQDGTPGGVSGSPPAASVSGLGTNPFLSRRQRQEPLRRGPVASSFPGSGITNIPIPSRYINPQPFNHMQYTASTGSHIFRPRDISTGYSHHNGYHRRDPTLDSNLNSRGRSVHSQPRPYSETIERAETGGWTVPNLSSTAGPTSSQQRDPGLEYRLRADIGMKEVIRMACRFCETVICERGMKAQLLADHTIGLMSTDDEPHSVQFVGEEYRPTNCYCKIMDTACLVW
ncbi:hypothetical protein EMPS_00646 [Entomortierella parvispora]|uniref:Uncharacterized protein n=1 Tax=Entomortierella parvispora TaxID=205924 RepID=A0A9P3H1G5_9FUNG|nr:hypothetical protein EMPS_00646 [Entomortierella parvispora]